MATRAERYTATSKKEITFSDFMNNLDRHPLNGTVARLTNEDAVKQSIKNLLLTNIYERFYQPEIGSGINSLLFEPMTEITVVTIREMIKDTIRIYEPRAQVMSVDVFPVEDRNEYNINILFNLTNSVSEVQLDLILKRTR